MTEQEEYGLEDVCVALDAIEETLKKLVALKKYEMKKQTGRLVNIAEIEAI